MEVDKFPADAISDLDNVIAKVDGQTAPRQPLKRASEGWILPDRATPPTPDGGVHITSVGGEFTVVKADGSTQTIPDPFVLTPAASVPNISGTPGSAPASYDQAYIQSLRTQLDEIRTVVNAMITSEEVAGLRDPN